MNKSTTFIRKLYESVDNEFSLLIVTSRNENKESELFRTAQRLEDICKERKIPCYVVFVEDALIERKSDFSYLVHNVEDKKGFEIVPSHTVAIIRGSVARFKSSLDLISQLEKAGVFCVNFRDCIETCGDKYRTILRLADVGIPTPKTALIPDEKAVDRALKMIGDKFPIVVKTLSGSKGIGVFFIESRKSLTSILQVIWKLNDEAELLVQEYIPTKFDVRVHVLGDQVIASMKREVLEKDFRSNFSLGGKVEEYKLSEKEKKICILASKSVGATWSGVDFIPMEDGDLRIIEINSSPGTEGIEKATKEDIVAKVVDFVSDRENWTHKALECGFLETVHIEEFGDLVAKFDTGNGNYCFLHAEDWEVDEKTKTITWKFNNKKYKREYVEIYDADSSLVDGLISPKEKRPIVKFTVKFNNEVYPDIRFALVNRETKNTPILINRRFMRKARVMVNPDKKFILSNKPKEEKK